MVDAMIDLAIVRHELKVIGEFGKNPGEDVASVNLEVGGVDHVILISEQDFPQLLLFLNGVIGANEERVIQRLGKMKAVVYLLMTILLFKPFI